MDLGLGSLSASLHSPRPVYVFVGSEALLVRAAEHAVRDAIASGPMAAFNHAVFTAGEEAALAFAGVASTAPMMVARRLVEVRQVQDASAALLDALLAYVAAPVPSTVLVVSGEKMPPASGGVDRGLRLVNAAKKVGEVHKLDGEGVDAAAFAMSRARDLGVALDRDAARAIAEKSGGELALVVADLEKCAGFVGPGGTVDRAVVDEVCVSVVDAEVWALTDALVEGHRDRALAALHHLLEDGEAPHKLLASVAWQLRQILLVQDAERRGLRDSNVRMPPQKIRAVRELVTRRPLSPSALLEEMAAANHAMNSSRAGDRRVIEALVLRLSGL